MKDVEEHLVNYFGLTEEDRNRLLSSGNQPILKNRVGWARTYLYKAKLVDVPQRGNIVITERGLEALREKPSVIDVKYLMQFPEFVEFRRGHKKERDEIEQTEQTELSPLVHYTVNVGVEVKETIEIKKIDEDYFEGY